MSKKYWEESLGELFSEHGIKATPEIIKGILFIREMESEACGYLCIPNPLESENKNLKEQLKTERQLVICKTCMGQGYITTNFADRSSTSSCYKCNGTGKVKYN